MASAWGELKRRNVVKVAVAYAIVGWLLIEVASTVFPIVQLPDWMVTLITMLLILGFPVALILSWAFELTPKAMMRCHVVEATESITQVIGRKIDFAIIGALVLALGFVAYNYVLEDGVVSTGVPANSFAVLQFDNLSSAPEDAYFDAAVHDETLSQLAKLGNFHVNSRTSVVGYVDSDLSIPEIARELTVGTVIKGDVRYTEDRVRVLMQLIDAVTDQHLWSEINERDFADIFAIESDIATNVSNALEAKFSPEEQERFERSPEDSPAAYTLYLRSLTPNYPVDSRVSDVDNVIVLDPEFALAYARRAVVYGHELLNST